MGDKTKTAVWPWITEGLACHRKCALVLALAKPGEAREGLKQRSHLINFLHQRIPSCLSKDAVLVSRAQNDEDLDQGSGTNESRTEKEK